MWLLLASLAVAQIQPAADVAQGQRWYNMHCAACHGLGGDGGRGANLATPKLRHAADDPALFDVISRGIPGTEMPRSLLTPEQVRQVAAYVRSLGRVVESPAQGDARRGEQIFLGKGNCRNCHTIRGYGGSIGPDLTDIGARSSPGYLRRSLTEPNADVPAGFRRIRAAGRDGRRVEGIRVNEDTFSIQIRDLSGRVHSLWKADLTQLEKDRQSLMPGYQTLSTAELDDLAAYLISLQ
ncbi:MAG: c-type cytochrome [Acidobacteria bacterium]|nr:c-type cytochrome [Acidobacteriota bacterium]